MCGPHKRTTAPQAVQTAYPLVQALASSQSTMNTAVCNWENCGLFLDDETAGGCTRHLKQVHVHDWDNAATIDCRWTQPPQLQAGIVPPQIYCNRRIKCVNLGKHIAAVHLRSLRVACSICGQGFSRSDAFRRHQRQNCPGPNQDMQAGGAVF
ncbi:uncharacterized protein LAESUDRAFT_437795 [Laetiporus sulphureus 93-53]|uniref:C2H2-type domain-containing protein n=1 Tax=Laetiporus sulphureus 93-53 TaxID=1314785 RepID=A0A165C4I9_9APHY|nr:uncharacterized protein LAESUDRAFT_437795 [Laetiporus sulphureus 93-53]KZT02191.1 hypothetical protein LAESUDRAFT_437795 [Laetiporus sulphureus 93-53]